MSDYLAKTSCIKKDIEIVVEWGFDPKEDKRKKETCMYNCMG